MLLVQMLTFFAFKEVFVCLDQIGFPFPTHVSVTESELLLLNCIAVVLLLLVIVEEIGLSPQGEKTGNAEKLAEYICSSKYLKSST